MGFQNRLDINNLFYHTSCKFMLIQLQTLVTLFINIFRETVQM